MSNISYFGIKTIIYYEVRDFFREYQFNILAPLITTFLFVFIFSTINRYYSLDESTDLYMNFLVPGVVIAVVIQTSFNYLSEIIINKKQIGSFNDFLSSPMSRVELYIAFIVSSIFVSFFVGIINLIILSFFTDFQNVNFINLIYYLINCILIFSSLGAITGFLFFTWDVQSSISNFFIVPMSFLSGTFFSIDSIDNKYSFIFKYNPVYYLVEGFRSSFYDNRYIELKYIIFLIFLTLILFLFCMYIFKKGFRVIN